MPAHIGGSKPQLASILILAPTRRLPLYTRRMRKVPRFPLEAPRVRTPCTMFSDPRAIASANCSMVGGGGSTVPGGGGRHANAGAGAAERRTTRKARYTTLTLLVRRVAHPRRKMIGSEGPQIRASIERRFAAASGPAGCGRRLDRNVRDRAGSGSSVESSPASGRGLSRTATFGATADRQLSGNPRPFLWRRAGSAAGAAHPPSAPPPRREVDHPLINASRSGFTTSGCVVHMPWGSPG